MYRYTQNHNFNRSARDRRLADAHGVAKSVASLDAALLLALLLRLRRSRCAMN